MGLNFMRREVETKFYVFNQNNSEGILYVNDDVAYDVIIEAISEEGAVAKIKRVTENYMDYCPCCGERWSFDFLMYMII